MIYFARAGDLVKIGTASNVPNRIKAIKAGTPMPLTSVHVMNGGQGIERQLHHRFRLHHAHGEWFKANRDLDAFIAENAERMNVIDGRSDTKSGRTALWGIRCRPGLKEACQAIAREFGKLDSEWAEEVLEAAIAAHAAQRGPLAAYLAECLQPKPGARVEMEECQAAYASSGLRPLTTREFVESLKHFCRACGVKTKVAGDKVYLMDVELAGTSRVDGRLGPMGRLK